MSNIGKSTIFPSSIFIIASFIFLVSYDASTEIGYSINDLSIESENRCSRYARAEYGRRYSKKEDDIVKNMNGLIYSPYEKKYFNNTKETDIEHIVSLSEAHDSGLCKRNEENKKEFAEDLGNLTLASPKYNRQIKKDKDIGEHIPQYNQCWYADRVVQIKGKWELTVDEIEAEALERVLSECPSTDMIF